MSGNTLNTAATAVELTTNTQGLPRRRPADAKAALSSGGGEFDETGRAEWGCIALFSGDRTCRFDNSAACTNWPRLPFDFVSTVAPEMPDGNQQALSHYRYRPQFFRVRLPSDLSAQTLAGGGALPSADRDEQRSSRRVRGQGMSVAMFVGRSITAFVDADAAATMSGVCHLERGADVVGVENASPSPASFCFTCLRKRYLILGIVCSSENALAISRSVTAMSNAR